ncbi:TBC1 domain, member 5 [Lunasporangiospora selenospora]|uniref:TBC1 domain, member 5 n=1 Tax=Lunasporangiospora selenospora TaxID=979761 RepID=A0A9P6KFI1_9FUNG|nr:TBC1 domain, member 5 [Lunasporangiospora selenospora]
MLAAYAGKGEACKLLLERGADPHIKTSNGKNARSLSWDAGHRAISAYITKSIARSMSVSTTGSAIASSSSAAAPAHLATLFNRPGEQSTESDSTDSKKVASSPLCRNRSVSAPSASAPTPPPAVPSISPSQAAQGSSPKPDDTSADTANILEKQPSRQRLTVEPMTSTRVYSVHRQGVIPRYGSKSVHYFPEEQPVSGDELPAQLASTELSGAVPDPSASTSTASSRKYVRLHRPSNHSLSEQDKEQDKEADLNRRMQRWQELKERTRNPIWVRITVFLTTVFCCCCGGRGLVPRRWSRRRQDWTQDRRQDRRDKWTICFLLTLFAAGLTFLLFGLALVTCRPESAMTLTSEQFMEKYSNTNGGSSSSSSVLVMVRGSVYDFGRLFQNKLFASVPPTVIQSFLSKAGGQDLSFLFPSPDSSACQFYGAENDFGKCTGSNRTTDHCRLDPALAVLSTNVASLLAGVYRSDIMITFEWSEINDRGRGQDRDLFAYGNRVYDITDYLSQSANVSSMISPQEKKTMDWFKTLVGKDASKAILRRSDHSTLVRCIEANFRVGTVAGQTDGCLVATVINTFVLVVIVLVSMMRLVSAWIYWWILGRQQKHGGATRDKSGEVHSAQASEATPTLADRRDSYPSSSKSSVLALVVCRATDERDQIKATLDSVAGSFYDPERMLMLIVCDHDTTLPPQAELGDDRVGAIACLDLLGLDRARGNETMWNGKGDEKIQGEPESSAPSPQPGKITRLPLVPGARQVYACHYQVDARRVPCLLVTHSSRFFTHGPGADTEFRSWESKRIVLQWLYRVGFNEPLSQFEYELFEKARGLTGHTPDIYQFLWMTSVGTTCDRASLGQMTATLDQNEQIMGICGQGILSNRATSWLTRLQDYENHMWHQLTNTFESTVGAVQSLPSEFSLVRIKVIGRDESRPKSIDKLARLEKDPGPGQEDPIRGSVESDEEMDSELAHLEEKERGRQSLEESNLPKLDTGLGIVHQEDLEAQPTTTPPTQPLFENNDPLHYWNPIAIHPEVVCSYVDNKASTLHDRSLVFEGVEDRFLTGILHKTFPTRRIVYLPLATYQVRARTKFWPLVEDRRQKFIGLFFVLWDQMWAQDMRGFFCWSINFLVILEWLVLWLRPLAILLAVVLTVVYGVGAAREIGALGSLPVVLALAIAWGTIWLQPILGLLVGARTPGSAGLAGRFVGLFLYLVTMPLHGFIIPLYAIASLDRSNIYDKESDNREEFVHSQDDLEVAMGSTKPSLDHDQQRHEGRRQHWVRWKQASSSPERPPRQKLVKQSRLQLSPSPQTLQPQSTRKPSQTAKWAQVFEDPSLTLDSLKARAVSQHSNLGADGIRSVCWKVYLSCLPSLEISTWPSALHVERERYNDLRKKFIQILGNGDGPERDLEVNNPLSLAEDSPWQQFFADSELRKVIKQDVERTLPDIDYFRSDKVQDILNDILFIYCKINHDVSYRQGMHELVAHILYVVSSESLDADTIASDESSDATLEIMKSVLDSNHVEHDTYMLFSSLMERAKPWYEFSDEKMTRPKPKPGKQTPVIEWSEKIFFHLQRIDNELFLHLKSLEIQPQLFGIRWFRLLFGREFPMEDALCLWDGIFANDSSLKICIFIGVALLLKIKDELLEGDFSECLHKLMRYPAVKDVYRFIPQALRLQQMPNAAGGQEIIRQNCALAGKPLPPLPVEEVSNHRPHIHHQESESSQTSNSSYQQHSSPQQHQRRPGHHAGQDYGKGQGNGVLSQHLPPAALDAIKPVAEGFAHVTKNVLESKGGAALNKAIHDMKKNTQSYIRKANTHIQSPSPPSFPPMFDNAINSSGRLATATRSAPSQQLPHKVVMDQQMQAQLGQVVAKVITILKAELSSSASRSDEKAGSGGKEGDDPSFGKGPSKAAKAAMTGLEHVHDILFEITKEFDPQIIESNLSEPPVVAISAAKEQRQENDTPVNATTSHEKKAAPKPAASKHAAKTTAHPGTGATESVNDRPSMQAAPRRSGQFQRSTSSSVLPETHTTNEPGSPTLATPPLRSSGSSGLLGAPRVKSPRSTLAQSKYGWMLDGASEEGHGGQAGSGISSTPSSSLASAKSGTSVPGPKSTNELFSAGASATRVALDPMGGYVSRRSDSASGRSIGSLSHQGQQSDEDPLRAL